MSLKKMSQEDFDRLLVEEIDEQNDLASELLSIPGVYEILSEHYNNDVLDAWRNEQELLKEQDALDEKETDDESDPERI